MMFDGSFSAVFKNNNNASGSSKLKLIMLLIWKHTEAVVALEILQLK